MYNSLGIPETDRKAGVNKNFHLDTIHMRGTEHMDEDDVMDYFQEYSPVSIEIVDNMSCNIRSLF